MPFEHGARLRNRGLDDDPWLVDCEFDALRVGLPVEVTFRPASDDVPLPLFRPTAGAVVDLGHATERMRHVTIFTDEFPGLGQS